MPLAWTPFARAPFSTCCSERSHGTAADAWLADGVALAAIGVAMASAATAARVRATPRPRRLYAFFIQFLRSLEDNTACGPCPTTVSSLGTRFPPSANKMCVIMRKATKVFPAPCLRSEEHTSELQSHVNLVCRLLLEKKKKKNININNLKTKIKKKKKII